MKNLSQFINSANTPQNTGGGTSHSSTVVPPVWKGSRPTVSRRSTDGQSQGHYTHTPLCKALKYAAMLLMVLTLGIGNVWGESVTVGLTTALSTQSGKGGSEVYSNASNSYLTVTRAAGTIGTGSDTIIANTGGTQAVKMASNTNQYAAYLYNMKKSMSTYSSVRYAGYSVTVADGYKYSLTALNASIATTANYTWKVVIINSSGTVLYTTGDKTITNYNATTATNYSVASDLSKTSNVQDLTGTFYVRAYFYFNSSGKYFCFPTMTVTGNLESTSGGGGECTDADPELAYATDEVEKTNGDAKFTNTLTNSHSVTVTYESSDEDIATVDEDGEVTIKTYGEVTITASSAAGTYGGNAYCADEASYTLTINKRSYTISYAAGDAEGVTGSKAAESKTEDVAFTLPSSAVFERAGYIQTGWNTESDGENGDHYDFGGSYETNAAQTFFPEWTTAYTLAYNANGGTGSMSNTVGAGTVTLRANAYTKDGYVFAGWATSQANADAGTIAYADAATTYSLSADATLYAVWYTVYYSFAPTGEVSSTSLSADDVVASSTGGSMTYTPASGGSPTLKYATNGLEFGSASQCQVTVTLNTAAAAGDIIEAKIYTGADSNRGLKIANSDGTAKANFSYTATGDHIGVYTIMANDKIAEATSFKVLRNNNAYLKSLKVAKWVAPEPSCDATAPGNINKGTASGGKGKITLTVTGSPETGDKWYWQEDEDGEDDEDEHDAENGKEVSAAGTYYLRSYNTAGDCWSTAKSVTVDAADLLTAISPTLSYATSNIVVGNTSSPTLEGNTGSGSVSYALNDVSPAGSLTINPETGVVTAVTVGGTATVTATIAANGNYAAGEATSETITVVAPATGTATISYALSGSTTTGTVTGVSTISSLSSSLTLSTLTLSGTNDNYSGAIKGCTSTDALAEDDYVDVQFTVASGYAFTPSSVTVKANPFNETSALKAVVKIMDAQPLVVASNVLACEKNTDNAVTFASAAFTDKEFEGTVHIRMYFYGPAGNKPFYIKSPISITGTVATKVVKYNLSFAAGTGASGSMSTLKYAEGAEVTLPACTFTAPSGKEFDAWVVTETVSGDAVTVTDGAFTMPAVAVTAMATWKDRPKHTDATLSDLTVAGETVDDFDAATTSYNVELPFGTFAAPTVAATATDASYVKSVVVTQASSATGDATVVVTAEDGSTTKTYTVHFSVEESKNIELVWKTSGTRCGGTTTGSTAIKSNDASVSTYINQITFTNVEGDGDDGAEGSSLNIGKKAGNMFILTAKPGFAFQAMSFFAKIQDATCEYSLDGGAWTTLTSTKTDGDACYSDIFSAAEVHEFRLRSTGAKGVWIRNMQLTMIQACTSKTIAWTAEPAAEYELGISPTAIAASANNGTVSYASTDGDVIAVNSSNGALTLNALGTVTLSASVPGGDGAIYCVTPASVSKVNVKTYYLVTFDAQNETAVSTVKYYKNGDAIALPSTPEYSGYDFLGWFDAPEDGNPVTSAITPTASCTVYAQWEAKCTGPTITVDPSHASYLTGRAAVALTGSATASNEGELTYTWYSCDDAERTNPVALAGAPTPSTASAGTQYYYFTVTEAGCDVVKTSDVAVITVTDKDPICIIKATPTSATAASVEGACKGNAYFKGRNDGKKLNSTNDYVGVELSAGYTFLATDKVVLNQAADLSSASDITKFYIFTEVPADGKSYVTVNNTSPEKGDNWFTMPAEMVGESALYIGRVDSKCNPSVGYLAVYRTCAPILRKVTVNGVDGTPNATNHIALEVPYSTTQSQLEAIAYTWASNSDEWTADPDNAPVAAEDWEFGVENTVTFTDKDGDESVYYVTVTKATASTDATLTSLTVNGKAIALEEGVYEYSFELPFGTSAAPTVVATTHHAAAEATVDPCTLSGATITVVPESGEGDKQEYTLSFSVSQVPSYVIFDGSVEDDYHVSGTGVSTFAWTVVSGKTSDYKKNIDVTLNGKHYTKAVNIFGSPTDSENRYIEIVVPEGYMAKFYLAGATNSDGKLRSSYISKEKTGTLDESIAYASTSSYDGMAMTSDFQPAGTYYYCCDNSIRLYELSVTLYSIDYTRTTTPGRLGTICLPYGGTMRGAAVYEVAYFNPDNQKIYYDEVLDGVMVPGLPYVFLPEDGNNNKLVVMYGNNVPAAVAGNQNGLYGYFSNDPEESYNVPKNTGNYIISENKYWYVDDDITYVPQNRAYLKVEEIYGYEGEPEPAPAVGRRRVSMGAGAQAPNTTTGFDQITNDQSSITNKVLINGQLFILRGQKLYDATGRMVK